MLLLLLHFYVYVYAMHFSISIFMGLKKRDTNNELTIRLIRSHQQVVTKAEWMATGRSICWLAGPLVGWLDGWHRLASLFSAVVLKTKQKHTYREYTVCSIIKSALHSIFDASASFIFCTESVNIIRPVYFAASVFHIKIVVAVITNYFQNYYRCCCKLFSRSFSVLLLCHSIILVHTRTQSPSIHVSLLIF